MSLARAAGIPPERRSITIERVGNTSSASSPRALSDAVRAGVITRPLRMFAPGVGAVDGDVLLRVDPAVVHSPRDPPWKTGASVACRRAP